MKYSLFFILLLTSILTIAQNKNQSIGFKENKGQIVDQNGKSNDAVKYLLNSRGLNVQLKKQGFSYDVYEIKKRIKKHHHQEQNSLVSLHNNKNLPDYILEYSFHRIDIDFVNANTNVELITDEASSDYDNYYNVPNKPEGITHVHQYKQITYKNIYPNIDVIFSIPKDTLKTVEYNFVVHPKGNIQDIQLKFSGVTTELNHETLLLKTRFGKMEETLPASWTEDGKCKKEITVGYTKIKNNVYGFKSSENVFNKTVVIDPVPMRLWGTYYGGEEEENNFNGIVKTNNQFVYIGGYTNSLTNISTSGSSQPNLTFYNDGFIAKFDSQGQRIWGTYYGGSHNDIFMAIDFDSNENIYATGYTSSTTNIATPGSHQTTYNDWYDGMLIKFDSSGQRIWGTYYGGEGIDQILTIKIDHNQDILVAGTSHSINNIATVNSFKSVVPKASYGNNQGEEGFLTKFTANGQRLWATYYGGNDGHDWISSIDVDTNNNIFCSGTTSSFNGISTTGAYNEVFHYDTILWNDTFVVKFNTNGQRLFGSYYGGTDYDYNTSIKVDNENNFIITGYTRSIDGIGKTNSFQPNNGGSFDSYLAKFTNNGNLIWSTFYGGKGDDGLWGKNSIDIDENNSIYFYSSGTSNNNISTISSYQENLKGYANLYIVKFKPTGERIWGTYYGGQVSDYSGDISYYKNGIFYISGWTYSNSNIASSDAFQNNIHGIFDAFLIKFKDCFSTTIITSNSPICGGTTLELKASGGTNYNWTGPNGFSSTLQNPIIPNTSISNSGQYSCAITGTGDCDSTLTTDVIIGDTNPPIPNITTLPTINGDCSTIILIPSATDPCDGLILATTSNSITNLSQGTHTIVWKYTDSNGNSTTQNQTVIISNQAISSVTSPQNFCIQQNVTLNNIIITGQNIKWYDALTNGNNLANTSLLQNGTTYYASQTINGCESDRVPISINIQTTATPSADSNQIFCASQNPTLSSIQIAGTAIKWYDINGNDLTSTILLQNNQTYYATQTVNNCESSIKSTVTISLISSLPANNYSKSFCDNLNDATEAINLMDYNTNLTANTNDYSFNYYTTLIGAENQLSNAKITNPNNYNITLGENKIYVRINSNTPCFAIAELKLSLFPKPNILINDLMPICENSSITINAGSNFTNYLWSTGNTNSSIIITNPGDYSVLVSNDYGSISCSSTKNFVVKKSIIATITSIETKDWTDTNNSIIIYTTGTGDYEYSLDRIHYQVNNEFSNLANGKYTVSVRDKNGCGIVNDTVYLLMYPKFFTPNGDGFNDTWKIKFSDNENDIVIKIFDRYGKLIKELSQNNSWDGTYIGNQLPADDYWFTATRPNTDTEYKGHFSLKR